MYKGIVAIRECCQLFVSTSWASMRMRSYFWILQTLHNAPHPSKHEIIDDTRIESGRTQQVCV